MRAWLQDKLNAGHIYCRLKDLGVSTPLARRWACAWGRIINPILYR